MEESDIEDGGSNSDRIFHFPSLQDDDDDGDDDDDNGDDNNVGDEEEETSCHVFSAASNAETADAAAAAGSGPSYKMLSHSAFFLISLWLWYRKRTGKQERRSFLLLFLEGGGRVAARMRDLMRVRTDGQRRELDKNSQRKTAEEVKQKNETKTETRTSNSSERKKVAKAKKSVSERVRCRNKNLLPFPTSPFFIDSALTRAAHVHNIMERGGGKTGGGGKCEGEARGGKTQKRRSCLFLPYDEAFDEIEKKLRIFFPESG